MSIIWPLFLPPTRTQQFKKAMISILNIKFLSVYQYLFIEHSSNPVNATIYLGWEGGDK